MSILTITKTRTIVNDKINGNLFFLYLIWLSLLFDKSVSLIFISELISISFSGNLTLFSFIETAKAGILFSICFILKISLGGSLLSVW